MDVERLVSWALSEQGLGWSSPGANGTGWEALGTRVDTSSWGAPPPSPSLMTDDDAVVVRQVIDALPTEAAMLVIQYGRIGGRPDWCEEGVGHYQQMRNKRGQLMWDYINPKNRRGLREPRLEWVGLRQEKVDWYRAQYQLWWVALHDLVEPLNARMENHIATGPAVSVAPWIHEQPVIHKPKGCESGAWN